VVQVSPSTPYFPGAGFGSWLRDGSGVVYRGAETAEGFMELFAVDADGSDHTPLMSGFAAWNWDGGPGGRIAIVTDVDADDLGELFTIERDGTGLVQVSNATPRRTIADFLWSSDGRVLVYRPGRVTEEDVYYELHVGTPDGLADMRVSHAATQFHRVIAYEPR
jgi:hypothetical protein